MFGSVSMLLTTLIQLLLLLLSVFDSSSTVQAAGNPVVELDYATYRGDSGNNGITSWLGIRYAAPPLGNLRFAAPQDPEYQGDEVIDAFQHGDICPTTGSLNLTGCSEDCLFLDVWAPSNIDPSKSLLPVYFFIQGGGFNGNSNANYNGSGLIAASSNNMVVVTFNYRVGLYGFLASPEVVSSGSATVNNGLRDQIKALQWVKKYISRFGGNPDHVVIGGDSSGAASVALILTMNGSEPTTLYHGAALESVSFAPVLTVEESAYQYNNLVQNTSCFAALGADARISCLRQLTTMELQETSASIPYPQVPSYGGSLYMWNPVLDYDLIQDYTYQAFNTGAFQLDIPVIYGDDTNGGTVFAPRTTATLDQSNEFILEQFPYVTEEQLCRINEMYPITGPYFAGAGMAWRRTANAYGEMRYMCPNLFIATAYATHAPQNPFWSYWWNVEDPLQVAAGNGVPHTVEIHAVWGPSYTLGTAPYSYYEPSEFPYWKKNLTIAARASVGTNAWIVPVTQRYWTRFITDLNPNGSENETDCETENNPQWNQWSGSSHQDASGVYWGQRMRFDSDKSLMGMEDIDDGLKERCEFWWSIGLGLHQ